MRGRKEERDLERPIESRFFRQSNKKKMSARAQRRRKERESKAKSKQP